MAAPGHRPNRAQMGPSGEIAVPEQESARSRVVLALQGAQRKSMGSQSLARRDRVLGVVLLCAHPRNAFYVAKWTFMCPLRGSKMGRLGAVLGQFRRCWGHEVPFLRCFGQIWPRNAI